jgi:hypothetical protein
VFEDVEFRVPEGEGGMFETRVGEVFFEVATKYSISRTMASRRRTTTRMRPDTVSCMVIRQTTAVKKRRNVMTMRTVMHRFFLSLERVSMHFPHVQPVGSSNKSSFAPEVLSMRLSGRSWVPAQEQSDSRMRG